MGMLEKISMYSELWQEKVLEKKKAQKNKLERDEEGKPVIKLISLENTVIHTPTQEDYDTLMQVYECGGWIWPGRELPTYKNYWNKYKEKTCVRAGRELSYGTAGYGFSDWKVLSTQEFYKKQKITKSMINEIKNYFENKK